MLFECKLYTFIFQFCGNIIGGLSLLSDSVMRLVDENHSDGFTVYALLPRRSLYIMK